MQGPNMSESPVLWHNPRCSKSRQTLSLLKENGFEPTVRLYLEDPPSVDELRSVLGLLGLSTRDLMRKKESLYKTLDLGAEALSEDELLAAMNKHPKLIERPVCLYKGQAAIGRPPENTLSILGVAPTS